MSAPLAGEHGTGGRKYFTGIAALLHHGEYRSQFAYIFSTLINSETQYYADDNVGRPTDDF